MLLGDAPVVGILPATNLERARRFWNGLGVREVWTEDRTHEVMFEAGRGTMFVVYERGEPTRAEHTVLGFDVEDLDTTMSLMRERGIEFEEYDLPYLKTERGVAMMGDTRGAWFRDSEGNIINVAEAARMMERMGAATRGSAAGDIGL